MKKTSIITAALASASLMVASAAFADPIVITGTMTQTLTSIAGCKVAPTSQDVMATFDDSDNTYSIVDTTSSSTILEGRWFKVDGKSGSYTLYMASNVYAPGPYDDEDPSDPNTPVGDGTGSLDSFLSNLQITGNANCQTKFPGSVAFVKPSAVVGKNTVTVKNGVATLNISIKGVQASNFNKAGTVKLGKFVTTLTVKKGVAAQ